MMRRSLAADLRVPVSNPLEGIRNMRTLDTVYLGGAEARR